MRLHFFLITAAASALLWPTSALAQCAPATAGLTCTTRTTLSVNVDSSQTVITVASGTDIAAGDALWVDFEQMDVTAVSSTRITVRRGVNGTAAQAHDSGDNIYSGDDTGGPTGSGHFNTGDPDWGQDCTRAQGQASHLPWINVRTGAMWTCDNGLTADWSQTRKPPTTLSSSPNEF